MRRYKPGELSGDVRQGWVDTERERVASEFRLREKIRCGFYLLSLVGLILSPAVPVTYAANLHREDLLRTAHDAGTHLLNHPYKFGYDSKDGGQAFSETYQTLPWEHAASSDARFQVARVVGYDNDRLSNPLVVAAEETIKGVNDLLVALR